MKKILIIMLFLLGIGATAQEITMEIENFSDVDVSRGLVANFTQAAENKVVITGASRDKVSVEVKKGVLIIKTTLNKLINGDDTSVEVYYKQVQSIEARQSAIIKFNDKIEQPFLRVRAREGASILANVEVENLVASAVTGGDLNLTGIAVIQEIDVKAGGNLKGENLKGERVTVSLNGGGNANIFSTEYVKATVRAGGHIYIYGNPKTVDETTTFGGTIKRIN